MWIQMKEDRKAYEVVFKDMPKIPYVATPVEAGQKQPDVLAREDVRRLGCIDVIILAVPRDDSKRLLSEGVRSSIKTGKSAGHCVKPTIIMMRPMFQMMDELASDFPTLSIIHGKVNPKPHPKPHPKPLPHPKFMLTHSLRNRISMWRLSGDGTGARIQP